MRTTRVLPLVLAPVLALAATGCGSDFKKDEPQTAVRDFLSVALARDNGQQACDWMTQREQKSFAPSDASDTGQACRHAMQAAVLDGDRDKREVDTTGDVKDLKYSTQKSGDQATVTVKTDGGPTLTFKLAHDDGLGNIYEPKSPWRIDGGAEGLVQGS